MATTTVQFNGREFVVEEELDYLLIQESNTPNQAWKISLLKQLGVDSRGGGLFIVEEALNGLKKLGGITIQWNEQRNAFCIGFITQEGSLNIQYRDINSRVSSSVVDTPLTTYHFLSDQNNQVIIGSVPETAFSVIQNIPRLFTDISGVLDQWLQVAPPQAAPLAFLGMLTAGAVGGAEASEVEEDHKECVGQAE